MSDGSQRPPNPRDPATTGTLVRTYSAADLLMTGIQLYFRHFAFFAGTSVVAALVVVAANVLILVLGVFFSVLAQGVVALVPGSADIIATISIPVVFVGTAIYFFLLAIAPVIAFIAVMIAMLQVCAGRRPSIGGAFAALRNDRLRHVVTGLLPLLITSSPLILLALPFSYSVLVPVVIVLMLLPATLLVNALPSVVVEGATVSDPVMRSQALGRGNYVRNALVILVIVALQIALTWAAFAALATVLPDVSAIVFLLPGWLPA